MLADMTQEETDLHNREQCRRMAEEVEAYAEGRVYRDEDGDTHVIDSDEEPGEDWEQLGVSDYLDDVLDITYMVSRDRDYQSALLYVAVGGPTIWIDTDTSYVRLTWGGDTASYALAYSARDALDEELSELWRCE
jgi:hypothetical protein